MKCEKYTVFALSGNVYLYYKHGIAFCVKNMNEYEGLRTICIKFAQNLEETTAFRVVVKYRRDKII